MSDSIMLDKLENNLAFFSKMYDAVRLVDPVDKKVIEYRGGCRGESDEVCHAYWSGGEICDNCISVRAYLGDKCFLKLEQSPDAIMMVTALPVEGADKPTVLELIKNTTETMMIGDGTYTDGRMLHNLVSDLNDLAIKDELTGIYNRRYVDERLPADIAKAILETLPLSIVFLDIDNFKEINDTYGHVLGDKALKDVTKAILHCIRTDTDWVARYGGDEFLICLYNTPDDKAYRITERIRSKISGLVISQDEKINITASLGVSTMKNSPLTAGELISLADSRMYEAKQSGKNRIVSTEDI